MRPERELDELVAKAIAASTGTVPAHPCPISILARDEAELYYLEARLKGRHHNRAVSIRLETEPERTPRHARTL